MKSILIKGGTLLTMDEGNAIVAGDLLIRDGVIASVGESGQTADVVIDAEGCAVLPGFVQTHIHLCQTIFRGAADDLPLLDWLKKRVWPMEAAHDAASIKASARLGVAELIKGGTTCALTMETVNHTEEVFRVVEKSGFRATVGKCMMDKGDDVPVALHENMDASIDESLALIAAWHGKAINKRSTARETARLNACLGFSRIYFLSEVAALALGAAASTFSSRTAIPSLTFTSLSMRLRISGFSFSVALEFSRPCPRRSPL